MSRLIGIDLGTSNTRIYIKEKKKIALRAPSVVSFDRASREVIASGRAAKLMLGKTPGSIMALRPLKDGVITDLQVTSMMLHDFFERLSLTSVFNRPSALVSIPYGITEVERRAVEDATYEAGAKSVSLIDEPIAAATGVGLDVSKARGAMLIDLGGGVSEATVISLGGVVCSNSLRIAGEEMDLAIINYLKQHRNILVGDITAEMLKVRIGAATPDIDRGSMMVCGRDLRTDVEHEGLAVTAEITTAEIRRALKEPLAEIIAMIKATLEETPPELSADIFDFGIVLTGGLSYLPGFAELIHARTGVRVITAKRPLDCVCTGLGRMLMSAGGSFSEFSHGKSK